MKLTQPFSLMACRVEDLDTLLDLAQSEGWDEVAYDLRTEQQNRIYRRELGEA